MRSLGQSQSIGFKVQRVRASFSRMKVLELPEYLYKSSVPNRTLTCSGAFLLGSGLGSGKKSKQSPPLDINYTPLIFNIPKILQCSTRC